MPNFVVKSAHLVLSNRYCYDCYQTVVGAYRYRDDFVANWLQKLSPTKVIDLGCGTAAIAKLLSEKIEYVGLDISSDYLLEAKKNRSLGNFQEIDIGKEAFEDFLNLKTSGLTLIICLGLFHHLNDEEIYNVLLNVRNLQNAVLISVDPFIDQQSNPVATWFARNDRGQHIRSIAELSNLFAPHNISPEFSIQRNKFRIPLDSLETFCRFNSNN